MKNVKKNLKRTEIITFIFGFAIAIILAAIYPITEQYRWEILIGYIIGMISIVSFAEGIPLIEKKTKYKVLSFIIFTNIKLVILAGLIYLLHSKGISAIYLIIGAITCQTTATVTLLLTLYAGSSLRIIGKNTISQVNN